VSRNDSLRKEVVGDGRNLRVGGRAESIQCEVGGANAENTVDTLEALARGCDTDALSLDGQARAEGDGISEFGSRE